MKKGSIAVDDPNKYFHCQIHRAARLLYIGNDIMKCPDCGTSYSESELMHRTTLQSKKSRHHKSKAYSQKRKKKLYDQQRNPINTKDKDIMQDIAQGRTVKEYREFISD